MVQVPCTRFLNQRVHVIAVPFRAQTMLADWIPAIFSEYASMHAKGLLPDMHTHIYIPDFESEVPTFLDHLAFFSDFCWRRLADVRTPTCFCAPKHPPVAVGTPRDTQVSTDNPHTTPSQLPHSAQALRVGAGAQEKSALHFPKSGDADTHGVDAEAQRDHGPQETEQDQAQGDGVVSQSLPVHGAEGGGGTSLVPLSTGRDRGDPASAAGEAQGSLGDPAWGHRPSSMVARDTNPQWEREHVRWSQAHEEGDARSSGEIQVEGGTGDRGSAPTHRLSLLTQGGEPGKGVMHLSQQPQRGGSREDPSGSPLGQSLEGVEEVEAEVKQEEAPEEVQEVLQEVAPERPQDGTRLDGSQPGSALLRADPQAVQRLWVPRESLTRHRLLWEETPTAERGPSIMQADAGFRAPSPGGRESTYAKLQQVLRKGLRILVSGDRRRLREAPSSQRTEGHRGPVGARGGSPRDYDDGGAVGGWRTPAPDLRTQALLMLGMLPEQAPSRPRLALVARTAKRLLLNVRELGDTARQLGIPTSILPLESLTLYEQITALHSSTVLAAMHGAALCTGVWLPANATVIQVPWKPYEPFHLFPQACTRQYVRGCACVRTCSRPCAL